MAKHCIIFPALMPTYSTYFTYSNEKLFEKSPNLKAAGTTSRWMAEKDSFFYYPYILLSAAHHYKKRGFRDAAHFTDETLVMVDSGGYQIATGVVDKTYNEKIALEWSEENGNIYPIVDRPITANCNWQDHIDLTKNAARYYIDHRSKEGHHILNVVSGRGPGEVARWYAAVKDLPLDGWAHGGHRGNLKSVLQTLFFMFNQGVFDRDELNFYHIFGVSSFEAMFYLNVFQKFLHEKGYKTTQITYDASTQTKTLAYGKLIHSIEWNGLKTVSLSNRIDFESNRTTKMYCDCPVCRNITDMKSLLVDNRAFEFYYILHQHNLYQVLKAKHIVEWMMEVTPGYKIDSTLVDGTLPAKYKKNLKCLYTAFDNPKCGVDIVGKGFQWKMAEDNSDHNVDILQFME